jgi:hypothetical protein
VVFQLATKINSSSSWSSVRKADDYREFLKAYLQERSLNYSDLSRAARFGRGFASDVISGRRPLTTKSYFAFEKALKIPLSGRKLFYYLVAREIPDIFPELKKEKLEIEKIIAELKAKSWSETRRSVSKHEAPGYERIIQNSNTLTVYAASGSPGKGATLDELRKRTGLQDREIEGVAGDLQKAGLLKIQSGIYEPLDLHLFFQSKDQSSIITLLFQKACQLAASRAAKALASTDEMFFTSAFCVDKSRLPDLKILLRETILKFVDESITPDGDQVVHLLTSLHLNR